MTVAPRNILLLKGHSAGVGDLLRSSAAWRALHDAFPGVQLHLAFFTQDPGSASEELISHHHLLRTFNVLPKWPANFAQWRAAATWLLEVAAATSSDLIIDFEPNGIRTSLLTWLARRRLGVRTVGIAEVAGRGLFYQRAAPGRREYARRNGQTLPLNYTERDFVALAALGIPRNGRSIELNETPAGTTFREQLAERYGLPPDVPLVGLNVGCGTPDAVPKRPDLGLVRALMHHLQNMHHCALVLTGAPFERGVNEELLQGYVPPPGGLVFDTAGHTSLLELTGVIRACALFISSDSGPYHMAVALRVPTVVIFNGDNPAHESHEPWVRCCLAPGRPQLSRLEAAVRELRSAYPWPEARLAR